jgi:hypothetical protein
MERGRGARDEGRGDEGARCPDVCADVGAGGLGGEGARYLSRHGS